MRTAHNSLNFRRYGNITNTLNAANSGCIQWRVCAYTAYVLLLLRIRCETIGYCHVSDNSGRIIAPKSPVAFFWMIGNFPSHRVPQSPKSPEIFYPIYINKSSNWRTCRKCRMFSSIVVRLTSELRASAQVLYVFQYVCLCKLALFAPNKNNN